jgi:hypothetical protein
MEYGNSFAGYSATLKDSIITTQKMDNIINTPIYNRRKEDILVPHQNY